MTGLDSDILLILVIENAVSGDQELGFGVPQGSVLGRKIYCMYTKPVSDIIQRHGSSLLCR